MASCLENQDIVQGCRQDVIFGVCDCTIYTEPFGRCIQKAKAEQLLIAMSRLPEMSEQVVGKFHDSALSLRMVDVAHDQETGEA